MEEVKLPTPKTNEELEKRREELFFSTGQDQFHKEYLIGKLQRDNQEILGINNELFARKQKADTDAAAAAKPVLESVPSIEEPKSV